MLSFPSDYSNSLTVATKLAKEQIEGKRKGEREEVERRGVTKKGEGVDGGGGTCCLVSCV